MAEVAIRVGLIGAGGNVLIGIGTFGKDAGAFHHHVNVKRMPRQVSRITFGEHFNRLTANRNRRFSIGKRTLLQPSPSSDDGCG